MALTTLASHELDLSALREVGNIGAGNAMTAFAEIVDQRVRMSVPTVDIVPIGRFAEISGGPSAATVGVYMRVSGEASGHVAFLWPETSAFRLAEQLLQCAPGEVLELGELERSALMEVGNILASSYLVAIGNLTGLQLLASPMAIAVDMSAAILSEIGVEVAMVADEAFIIVTHIGEAIDNVEGCFIFIPESGSLPLILRALQVEC